ncbi:hypothetical protein GW17_00005189 [Ensete ventricosum]|nr:hypothetical protein GW17_00005189 [Ensete ventricosum]
MDRRWRLRKKRTVLSLARWSREGTSQGPHTRRTSARARSCHSGCMARSTVVHVSRLEVVCFPAKKNVLHSSTMSLTVILVVGDDDGGGGGFRGTPWRPAGADPIPCFDALASIIRPSRSLTSPPGSSSSSSSSSSPSRSFRRPISLTRLLLISFSNFHELAFFFVGRNLQITHSNSLLDGNSACSAADSNVIPVARDEDLAEGLGREDHLLGLQLEDGLPVLVAPSEGGLGDGLLRDDLKPLGHIDLHLLAGGGQPPHHVQHRLPDERYHQLIDPYIASSISRYSPIREFPSTSTDPKAEPLALELPDQRVGLVPLEDIGPRQEDLADEAGVGDGKARGRPEPQQERGACKRSTK